LYHPVIGRMLSVTSALVVLGLFVAASAFGAFPEDEETPDLAKIKEQIEGDQAAEAESSLRNLLAEDPGNPDILNLLGYASRKQGRWQASRTFYTQALTIDPEHKGALEYMGELELETGDVEAARDLLQRLRKQCPDGCEELDDLLLAFSEKGVVTLTGGN